jgi:hypothetical protein
MHQGISVFLVSLSKTFNYALSVPGRQKCLEISVWQRGIIIKEPVMPQLQGRKKLKWWLQIPPKHRYVQNYTTPYNARLHPTILCDQECFYSI